MAWSALVRSRLYFDYVRNGQGKQTSETRVLSRKKANYSKKDADGQGIFLAWQDWNFVRVMAPEIEAASGKKAEEMAEMGRLIEIGRAIKELLKSIATGRFSGARLAHHLQGKVMDPTGKKYSVVTLRRDVQKVSKELERFGCAGLFDPDAKPHDGRWHYPDEMRAAEAKPATAQPKRCLRKGSPPVQRPDRAARVSDATVSLADVIPVGSA